MRTKVFLAHALCGVCLLTAQRVGAQATTLGNSGGVGAYSGWDGGTLLPLEVRHNGNQPIQWWTDSIQRMQLYHTRTGTLPLLGGGGGTVSVPQNGYLGISGEPGFFAPGAYGPFTRLHLADEDPDLEGINHYAQPWGYRSWMKNGVTFMGNHDHGYVGQRYYGHDSTDMVVQWSDNPATWYGPDRLRFLFTSGYSSSSASGAYSEEGLEGMRLYPVTPDEVHVGIGDFEPSSCEVRRNARRSPSSSSSRAARRDEW